MTSSNSVGDLRYSSGVRRQIGMEHRNEAWPELDRFFIDFQLSLTVAFTKKETDTSFPLNALVWTNQKNWLDMIL